MGDTSGPAINILVKLSAVTSLVFGGYLENYHIFENVHKEPSTYDYVSMKCNEAGDNPNTQEAVLAYCKTAITKGLSTTHGVLHQLHLKLQLLKLQLLKSD